MEKVLFFILFVTSIFPYNFYVGGGIASESTYKGNSKYEVINYPSVLILDSELSVGSKRIDVGLGLTSEMNSSLGNGKKYDVLAPYVLLRFKAPSSKVTPFVSLKFWNSPLINDRDKYGIDGSSFFKSSLGFFYKEFQFEYSYGGASLDQKNNPVIIYGRYNYALTIKKNIK